MPENGNDRWPALPLDAWRETRDTLHLWSQMVGKTRLALTPPLNHWWHSTLYVCARGLTTSPIPYGDRTLEIVLDLVRHNLVVETDDGGARAMPLISQPVREFHAQYLKLLAALGVDVHLWSMPVEIPDPIPFEEDDVHRTYDPEWAHRFLQVLLRADGALRAFAGTGFRGKQSPVQFFWGSLDLAYTRFSGRPAPERPGADRITREAYSHEVLSFGFWPGGKTPVGGGIEVDEPVFYAYGAPEPPGFSEAPVRPAAARYDTRLSEFLLPYDAVRQSASPRDDVVAFCRSVYEAGAELGGWDRAALEASPPPRGSAPGGGAHPPTHAVP
jgi:hypothetical protein